MCDIEKFVKDIPVDGILHKIVNSIYGRINLLSQIETPYTEEMIKYHEISKDAQETFSARYEINPILKTFFLECRQRAVRSFAQTKKSNEYDILTKCPRKWLWRLSAGHKTLARSSTLTIKGIRKEWEQKFNPDVKDFSKMMSKPLPINQQTMLHLTSELKPPSNQRWSKTSGCFELNREQGGTIAALKKFIHPDNLNALMKMDPLQVFDAKQFIQQKLFKNCVKHLQELFPPDEIRNCPLGNKESKTGLYLKYCKCSHPYLLELTVLNSPPGKVRMCTMHLSALGYCLSVLQKLLTFAMRNLAVSAESFERSPDWGSSIRSILQGSKRKDWLFHSGDLTSCTDRFIYQVSRALCRRLLEPYALNLRDEFEYLIDLGLGPFKVLSTSITTDILRSNDDVDSYLDLLNFAEGHYWFKNIIGQHLSNPLSFPNMAIMHAYSYAHFQPVETQRGTHQLNEGKEMLNRMMRIKSGGYYIYLIGVTEKGVVNWKNKSKPINLLQAYVWLAEELGFIYEVYGMTNKLVCPPFARHLQESVGYPVKFRPANIDFAEYKIGKARFKFTIRDENKGRFELYNCYILKIIRPDQEIPKIYMSDSTIKRTNYDPTNKPTESMVFKLALNKDKKPFREFINKPFYLFSNGDDHLGIANTEKKIQDYRKFLMDNFNQTYNLKADFISKEGAVIAERCFNIDQEKAKVWHVLYMKPRLILTEDESDIKWVERFPSITQWAINEYRFWNIKSADKLYDMITGAQDLLIQHNRKYWEIYLRKGICPSLPTHLGGLGYRRPTQFNKTTTKHLRNLNFLYKFNKCLFYVYQKRFNKIKTVSKTDIVKFDYNFKHNFKGIIPVENYRIKEAIYQHTSWRDALLQKKGETEVPDLISYLNHIKMYVKMVYQYVKYELNIQGSYTPPYLDRVNVRKGEGPHYNFEEYYLSYIKEEDDYYRIVKSKLKFKERFYDLGEDAFEVQPIYIGKGQNAPKWYNLSDLDIIRKIPKVPIPDPRISYLSKEGETIINKLSNISKEMKDKLNQNRVTLEVIHDLTSKLDDMRSRDQEISAVYNTLLVDLPVDRFVKFNK